MRIKKKNVGENIDKAKEYAKDSVDRLKTDLEPVSKEIEQGIKDITDNPKTASTIAKKMATSAINKAYSGSDSESDSESDKVYEAVNGKHTVEYHSDRTDETPFIINGIKWQYVNAIYPDGKRDIGVYRFDHDLTYDFKWFMDEVVPKPANYVVMDESVVSEAMSDISDTRESVSMFDYAWHSNLSSMISDKLDEFGVPHELNELIISNLSSAIWDSYHEYRRDNGGDIDENEDRIASDAIKQGIKQGEVGDSEYDEYQTLLRSLAADSKEIENDNKETNDLPFESIKPKMTKSELVESILKNSIKKRKVIKTISVKNLRNE